MRTRTSRAHRMVCLAILAALGLSACGGQDDDSSEPLSLDSESPSESGSAAEPESSAPEAIETSFPDIGLEITAVPEQPQPAKRELLSTWATFVHGHFKMTRTAEWNKMLSGNGTKTGLSAMRETQEYLQSNNARFKGKVKVELDRVQRRGNLAVVDFCIDTSRYRLVERGKAESGPPGGVVREMSRADLNFSGGTWIVTGYGPKDEKC